MNLYDIINPSDALTMRADSIEIAAAAIAVLTEGSAGVRDVATGEQSPVLLGWEEWLTKRGMLPLAPWLKANASGVCAALRSVRLGKPEDRDALDAEEAAVPEDQRPAWILARNDRLRSSMSDYEGPAHRMAAHLAKRLADADPAEAVA
jgi:hypothetical protein